VTFSRIAEPVAHPVNTATTAKDNNVFFIVYP